MNNKLRLCVVSQNAYGAMVGGKAGFIGGVEKQTALTAKWFAAKGHTASILTWKEGGPDEEIIDGVRIIKICPQNGGIKGLRFFHPKWTGLVRAMRLADAEVYYQNCGECVTGQIAMWTRKNGRKFVYSVASDPDCDIRLPHFEGFCDKILYRYGLRHADQIIVQTLTQQKMLREGFRLESTVIPMPCPGPSETEYHPSSLPHDNHARILWIGRLCLVKRPHLLLELAQSCPDFTFDVVGPSDGSDYTTEVLERATRIPNVNYHGPVGRDRVADFYQRASLLCCTSSHEGFPNTFIEAWSHGLPVVSTFDPDHLISTLGIGTLAGDLTGLKAGIRDLFNSPDLWKQASEKARKYYHENHDINGVMPKFEHLFLNLAGKSL